MFGENMHGGGGVMVYDCLICLTWDCFATAGSVIVLTMAKHIRVKYEAVCLTAKAGLKLGQAR